MKLVLFSLVKKFWMSLDEPPSPPPLLPIEKNDATCLFNDHKYANTLKLDFITPCIQTAEIIGLLYLTSEWKQILLFPHIRVFYSTLMIRLCIETTITGTKTEYLNIISIQWELWMNEIVTVLTSQILYGLVTCFNNPWKKKHWKFLSLLFSWRGNMNYMIKFCHSVNWSVTER